MKRIGFDTNTTFSSHENLLEIVSKNVLASLRQMQLAHQKVASRADFLTLSEKYVETNDPKTRLGQLE